MTDIVMSGDAGVELCRKAGRDPDELITKFILLDFAATLVEMDITDEQRIRILSSIDCSELGDQLCTVSHWDEIFENVAYMEEEAK